MRRRPLVAALLPGWFALQCWGARAASVASAAPVATTSDVPSGVTERTLRFPVDHAAHPDTHVEWWYVTGWLRSTPPAGSTQADAGRQEPPDFGFQVTFFRTRTGLAENSSSRFAARQLVFAHIALTDLTADARATRVGTGLLHDQRAAREGFGLAQVPAPDGAQTVRLHDWSLSRGATPGAAAVVASELRIDVRSERFALALELQGNASAAAAGRRRLLAEGPAALARPATITASPSWAGELVAWNEATGPLNK